MASSCIRIAQRTITSLKSNIASSSSSSFFKSTFTKSTSTPRSFILTHRNTITPQLGSLHSMLPFHTAVSSATMTSCLATNSTTLRSPLCFYTSLGP
ncbi:hypothetical protein Lal_00007561 [Lupinus albus]|uniref:Uncharacterized protein n=1 Tax=Lupinus albus TaxID=3870 RepID=A0A6A5MXB8_LUPAL|nr:hypothetical protein Lalb_Chr16g0379561 [Lupinus albus]KAF1874945.1 hypothetical protein Lal_00007561 [Lupinus albus]